MKHRRACKAILCSIPFNNLTEFYTYSGILSRTNFRPFRRLRTATPGQRAGFGEMEQNVYEEEIKAGTVIAVHTELKLNRGGDAPTIGRHPGFDRFWKSTIEKEAPPGTLDKYSTNQALHALNYSKPDTRVGEITIPFTHYYQVCR